MENEYLIFTAIGSSVNDLDATKLWTMIKKLLEYILRTSLHKTHLGVLSGVHMVDEQAVLHQLHNSDSRETLDAYIVNCFDIRAATEKLLKWLLTSSTNHDLYCYVRKMINGYWLESEKLQYHVPDEVRYYYCTDV